MASVKNKYQSQIDSETQLRYGPQLDALASLLQNARSDRNQALSVNASTAQALSNAARLASPEVNNANQAYLGQLLAARQTLGNPDTAAYAASGDPYKQALARDIAGAQVRAAETTKAASDELTQRGVDARAAAVAGARAINDRYASQADQISQQGQTLAGESGAYASSRLAELLGEDQRQAHQTAQARADRQAAADRADASNAQSERNSERSAGIDPDTGRPIPGGRLDPRANGRRVRWATPQQTGAFKDTVGSLQGWIGQNKADYLKSAGGDVKKARAAMAQDLLNGIAGSSNVDMDPRSPTYGQILKDPGVPRAKSQLALSVALDLSFDRHVSRRNVVELHRRRYKVKSLGFPTQAPSMTATSTGQTSSSPGLPLGPLGPVGVG